MVENSVCGHKSRIECCIMEFSGSFVMPPGGPLRGFRAMAQFAPFVRTEDTFVKAEILERLSRETEQLKAQGLFKPERVLSSAQSAVVRVGGGGEVINLCANNYLGLANDASVREAAQRALDRYGYGMASVRFICGTQEIHKDLEARLSRFLGTEDTILYSSCFDANGGLFETLLDEQDAVISDALNHASIIDGVRLCKAQRLRYANNDLDELEARLKEASKCRVRLIATDGVFSMDGVIARLKDICDLADRYDALVMVDDSHATGFVGARGRGTHELRGVIDRVDILTGTLGKALGGASGGYTSGRKEIIAWLRQRSRPYLFSNSIPPFIAAASLRVLDLLEADTDAARTAVGQRRALSRGHGGRRLQSRARRASDHPGHARRREARLRVRAPPARRRRVRHRLLLSRSCPKARRASARRCPPRTRASNSIAQSPRSARSARNWASSRIARPAALTANRYRYRFSLCTHSSKPAPPPASNCRTSPSRRPARTTS